MVAISSRLTALLDTHAVPYDVLHHRTEFTAQETAAETHTPGREFAKVVVVRVDGRFAMLVMPAHHRLDFQKAHAALAATEVRMATEDELRKLFPDCDVGAEPPLGNLYGLPVWISSSMKGDQHITFNAGTHEDAIRMKFGDYTKLVLPTYADFSVPR
jgi:Ala-tRNA(Pro) deacylase